MVDGGEEMNIPIAEIESLVSEEDRKWFENNPERNYRLRQIHPDEFKESGVTQVGASHVAVYQLRDGVRFRLPCNAPGFSDTERACKWCFEELLKDKRYAHMADTLTNVLTLI